MPQTVTETMAKYRTNNREKYNTYMNAYHLKKYQSETEEWRRKHNNACYSYFKKRIANDPEYAQLQKDKKMAYRLKKKMEKLNIESTFVKVE